MKGLIMSLRNWDGMEFVRSRWAKHVFSPTMSAQAFFLDFYVYPLLSLLCFGAAAYAGGVFYAVSLALFGWFCWTLLEYIVHRVALHHLVWFRDLHAAHHADPHSYIG